MERVGDMTKDELRMFVRDEMLRLLSERTSNLPEAANDKRSLREILDSIERNRWTAPPGSKSAMELLREDRER